MNTIQDEIFTRSAIEPEMRAAVMTANVSWNSTAMNVELGTFFRPNRVKGSAIRSPLPLPAPLVPPQPSDQPQRTKMRPTTGSAAKDIIIMLSTDFDRVMPP